MLGDGWPDLDQKWVRLAPNGTDVGTFQDRLIIFWLGEPKYTESDLKNSRICPIWDQSDPLWVQIWSSWLGGTQTKVHCSLYYLLISSITTIKQSSAHQPLNCCYQPSTHTVLSAIICLCILYLLMFYSSAYLFYWLSIIYNLMSTRYHWVSLCSLTLW